MIKNRKMGHIGLAVNDIEASTQWYMDVLGFELIGSFDAARGVAVLRWTPARKDGKYINFADNDQKNGAFSAADQFSIFNGADELNFHELETLAPMTLDEKGCVTGSELNSETLILRGESSKVAAILKETFGVPEAFLK